MAADGNQVLFGVNVDLHLKPFRTRPITLLYRLDESKNRLLLVRAGYRNLPSYTGGANENRGVLEVTPRYPLIGLLGHVLVSDRNRVDFRFIEGEYSWRTGTDCQPNGNFPLGESGSVLIRGSSSTTTAASTNGAEVSGRWGRRFQ